MAESQSGAGEKTESPTPKKLNDAKRKGDVLQSRELGTALVVTCGTAIMTLFGSMIIDSMSRSLRSGLSISPADIAQFDMAERTLVLLAPLLAPFGALFGLLLIAAVATPAMLGSLGFRWEAVQPKANKLNPLSGLKRMFGMNGLIELAKSLAKVLLIGAVGTALIMAFLPDMAQLGRSDIRASIGDFGNLFGLTLMAMSGCLVVIAMIDVPAQFFQRNKRLMMSKQEVRDEHKETEGSPELRQAVRRRQMEMTNGSARKAMTDATVLLVNPTHFAVALRYDRDRDAAPVVLARGRGEVAQAMRELALERKLPIMQYPELTRAIYFTSKAGTLVDERLYMAVATLLAFIFRINERMDVGLGRPTISVPDELRFDPDGKPVNPAKRP